MWLGIYPKMASGTSLWWEGVLVEENPNGSRGKALVVWEILWFK